MSVGKGQRRAFSWGVLLIAVAVVSSGCQGFALLDQPPIAKFTVTPDPDSSGSSIRVGDLVTLDASASSDPQGYELTYEWDLKKPFGSESRLSSATGKIVTFYPDDYYQFTISLTVTARVQTGFSGTRILTAAKPQVQTKGLLTVETDGNGSVEPWGFRPLAASELLTIKAVAKKGFKFLGWTVNPAGAAVANLSSPSTTVTLSAGLESTVLANFTTSPLPSFLGWTTVPYGFVRVDPVDGTAKLLGGDLGIVALAFRPTGQLYGVGDPFTARGARLYRLDGTGNSLLGGGVALTDSARVAVTVSGAAFSPSGLLYVVEKTYPYRLFTASLDSGQLSLVGTPSPNLDSLAFDPIGALFGSDGSALYRVDRLGASATRVGSFWSGTAKLGSLTFAADGRLFAIDRDVVPTSVYSIEPTTGLATLLATVSAPPPANGLLALVVEP